MRHMTFQDVKVRKPFAAVSGIEEKGNMVIFDWAGSNILPGDAPGVKEIMRTINEDRIAFIMAKYFRSFR